VRKEEDRVSMTGTREFIHNSPNKQSTAHKQRTHSGQSTARDSFYLLK